MEARGIYWLIVALYGITPEEIRQAVTERLPQKFHAINLKAIDIICKGAETL